MTGGPGGAPGMDIDELVREARMLRERLAATAAQLDVFTAQLQSNVDRLREISSGIQETGEAGDGRQPGTE